MTTLPALRLVAPAELPALADLDRFPGLDACDARVRVLTEQRHQLWQSNTGGKSDERSRVAHL
jgi:hypothetical protein